MATPAELIASATAAGAAPAGRRLAPRPATGVAGSAPGGGVTLSAPTPGAYVDMLKGFRPMGGGPGMPAPPAPMPAMAQGREVMEQDGQQGVMGDGGRFQPLGEAALSKLGAGGGSGPIMAPIDPMSPPVGSSRGGPMRFDPTAPTPKFLPGGGLPSGFDASSIIGFGPGVNKDQRAGGTADVPALPPGEDRPPMRGFRSAYMRPGGGGGGRTDAPGAKLQALRAEEASPSPEPSGMSSIGTAVGRAMRPRPMRSAVSREGAAPGY